MKKRRNFSVPVLCAVLSMATVFGTTVPAVLSAAPPVFAAENIQASSMEQGMGAHASSAKYSAKSINGTWDASADTGWFDAQNPKSEYLLSTAEQLAGFARLLTQGNDMEGITLRLSEDIDLGGKLWNTAGIDSEGSATAFRGVFDGDGHAIQNMTMEEDGNGSGFIRWIVGGTVENILFSDVNIQAGKSAGTICGFLEGGATLSNVQVTGQITATGNWIGGLTGNSRASSILNCNVDMELSTEDGYTYGLLAGYCGENDDGARSRIESCTVKGSVTATDYVGGAVGSMQNTDMRYVVAEEIDVTATKNSCSAGGLVAYSHSDEVQDCSSSGRVRQSGSDRKGGHVGGLIGTAYSTSIGRCFSSADVTKGDVGTAGGLVGLWDYIHDDPDRTDSSITESYATGKVTGKNSSIVGGLIGNASTGTIEDCYATGKVTTGGRYNVSNRTAHAGGLVGIVQSSDNTSSDYLTIKNSYAVGEIVIGSTEDQAGDGICYGYLIGDTLKNATMENCYYYSDAAVTKIGTVASEILNGSGKTSDELESGDFLRILNENAVWSLEEEGSYLYPVLKNTAPADYTQLDEALKKAEKLEKKNYVDFSQVEDAVKAAKSDLSIRNYRIGDQEMVDEYAEAIDTAIKNLVFKSSNSNNKKPSTHKPESATPPITPTDPNKPSTPSDPTGIKPMLDTKTVNMAAGAGKYEFLVNNNHDTKNIKIEVADPTMAQVMLADANDPRGAKYQVIAQKAGEVEIKVTYNGVTTIMKVVAKPIKESMRVDTHSYTLAPGSKYGIDLTLKDANGMPLKEVEQLLDQGLLTIRDSRTGSIVDMTVSASGYVQLTGKKEGTTYIQYQYKGQRYSVRVDVKEGATPGGISNTRELYWI